MFRIKNIRNSTVAKHLNLPPTATSPITPSIPQKIAINSINKVTDNGGHRPLPTRPLVRRNENFKIKIPIGQNRVVFASKVRGAMPVMKKALVNIKQQLDPKKEEGIINDAKQVDERQKKAVHIIQNCPLIAQSKTKAQDCEPKLIQKQASSEQQREKQSKKRQQEEELAKKAQQQGIARQEKRRMEQQEEEQQKKERQIKFRREQQEQRASNEAKMQQMVQKVNARRRAREQERLKRINFQKQVQNQQIGGIMALSDPLAHVEMSQAVMDAQVAILLRMKFAGYPNREPIEKQVEQLERINRSYLLVRTDPNNPLIRGLSNFRIELFNRIGELIMEAQGQMGATASGLQVIQADSRNYPNIKGVQVTRGMEGHFSMLSKKILKQAEECPICLCEVQAGKRVYDVACGHQFHEKCLQDWLKTNANCPACRYNIKFGHA